MVTSHSLTSMTSDLSDFNLDSSPKLIMILTLISLEATSTDVSCIVIIVLQNSYES